MLFLATVGAVAFLIGLLERYGHYEQLSGDCHDARHQFGRCCAGYCRSLFATGLGLLAAIPAVIAYNNAYDPTRFGTRLDLFADDFAVCCAPV